MRISLLNVKRFSMPPKEVASDVCAGSVTREPAGRWSACPPGVGCGRKSCQSVATGIPPDDWKYQRLHRNHHLYHRNLQNCHCQSSNLSEELPAGCQPQNLGSLAGLRTGGLPPAGVLFAGRRPATFFLGWRRQIWREKIIFLAGNDSLTN